MLQLTSRIVGSHRDPLTTSVPPLHRHAKISHAAAWSQVSLDEPQSHVVQRDRARGPAHEDIGGVCVNVYV